MTQELCGLLYVYIPNICPFNLGSISARLPRMACHDACVPNGLCYSISS